MWRSPMFWRLFGAYAVLILASLGLVGAGVLGRVEQQFLDQMSDSLRAKALLVGDAFRDEKAERQEAREARVTKLGRQVGTRITLLDEEGNVLADSDHEPDRMERHDRRSEVVDARRSGFGTATRHSATLGVPMVYGAVYLNDHRGPVAFVRAALPLDRVQAEMARLRWIVWSIAALTGIAALGVALGLARLIVRPLHELTAGAGRLAGGDYGHKVYAGGRDEIGVLARSFNAMSDRFASQFAELENDRHQLRTILSGMVEGVVAIDPDQRVMFANERAAQLLEFHQHPAVGRKLWEVVRYRPLHDVVGHCLANPGPYREEFEWNGRAARSLTVHAVSLPGPPARGVVLVLHDTSELRRLERLRQEFVANVSHELKTPLSVIKACVETLLDGAMDDVEHRESFLQQVAEQSERLHHLILDLLSLSRIESGTEAFAFQAVPLSGIVAECLERHRARAESRSQRLEAVTPPAQVTAWVDEEAVRQILENLVDNALKYTPHGGRIEVRWHAANSEACLEVEDTGIGIPEADLPRIFERFYRVDKARSRELGGTGLGLSIVKHLTQAMQGNVEARSRLGVGTTFTIRLPLAPSER